jgi:hypothetical protein
VNGDEAWKIIQESSPGLFITDLTHPGNMGTAGRTSGLVIQALRHLGQEHVDDSVIQTMKRKLSPADKKQLLADLGYAPGWVRAHLRAIAEGGA